MIYFVTVIAGHDPYAVSYRWPLSLTLDVYVGLQLRAALREESEADADRRLSAVGAR